MASRLKPEDIKGENNWADIEDDDEDWAPETITWGDGTKITIPHHDEYHAPISPAPAAAQPVTALVPKENGISERIPAPVPAPVPAPIPAAAPVPAPSSHPTPTPKTAVLASGKGLVLKGAPEKPTLVAKPPPPPAPVKSPWASIPKVEKISPIAPPPEPVREPVSRMPPRGSFSGDARVLPKEIAADDFSRNAWRDGPSHGNRELYNSQSGRLEPVSDRNAPLRQDARHPAVLHRPPHHDQQGPFEAPGPYPPGRNTEEPGPYSRRRGSSNLSGGSGSYHRLTTLEHPIPPAELVMAGRGSMTGRSDSPASPRNFSPSGLQGGPRHAQVQGFPPRSSPGITHAVPHLQGAQAPVVPDVLPPPQQSPLVPTASIVGVTEDDIELQKRLMRERRELALKRRQEQEAAEEAARRERIRKKLEALGPAPESNSAKKAAAKEHPPTQIQPRDSTPQKPGQADETRPTNESASTSPSESARKPESVSNESPSQALPPSEEATDSQPHTHAHPWPNTTRPAERYSAAGTWGPQPLPAPSKNVWGPPTNNRTLGNGTFVSDLPAAIPAKPGPGPIAPPSSSRSSQSGATVPTTRLPPIGPPRSAPRNEQVSGAGAAASETKPPVASSAWASNAVCLQDDLFNQILNAHAEERDRRLKKAGKTLADVQAPIKDTWRPTKLDADGRRADAAPKQTIQIGKDNTDWVNANAQKPTIPQPAPAVPNAAPSSDRPQPLAATASILGAASASGHGRGSRFFPSRDIRQESNVNADIRQGMNVDDARQKSPSPPPPDMAGHPAFDGDVAHPHVSLPRPQPIVKLPPSAGKASAGGSSTKPSFSWASQAAYRDSENAPFDTRRPSFNKADHPWQAKNDPSVQKPDSAWQAKFDSLLGGRKPHGHPKSPSSVLDFGDNKLSHLRADALFSQSPLLATPTMDASVTSKEMAEDCFEEQETGSLPPVRIPNMVYPHAWEPCPPPKPLPKKLYADVSTADPFSFPVNMSGAGIVWYVSFPGGEKREIVVPHGRNRSNPRRGGPRGGGGGGRSTPSAPRYGQGKGRDSNDQGGSSSSSANPPQGRSTRGGYRGRDSRENWSRNNTSSPAIQT